ncbi:MAG: hypothetical protein PHY71_06855 [Bacteroidaceae bacterium]|nr:hypothetical protein [Bacteroidaceae bacterium]
MVIAIAKEWKGKLKETDWIVKHACRTLLKTGNEEVMQLFDSYSPVNMELINLRLTSNTITIGDDLEFSFDLHNHSAKSEKIRLEYAIYCQKKNGTLSKKVYKISEKAYAPQSKTTIHRKQSFKWITTRKFHTGQHIVRILMNGVEVQEKSFELKEQVNY